MSICESMIQLSSNLFILFPCIFIVAGFIAETFFALCNVVMLYEEQQWPLHFSVHYWAIHSDVKLFYALPGTIVAFYMLHVNFELIVVLLETNQRISRNFS